MRKTITLTGMLLAIGASGALAQQPMNETWVVLPRDGQFQTVIKPLSQGGGHRTYMYPDSGGQDEFRDFWRQEAIIQQRRSRDPLYQW